MVLFDSLRVTVNDSLSFREIRSLALDDVKPLLDLQGIEVFVNNNIQGRKLINVDVYVGTVGVEGQKSKRTYLIFAKV